MTIELSELAIVLARPQLGENIGAAARAMANFGLCDLRIVAPRDAWPNPKAEAMAAGVLGAHVTAQVFDDVAGAIADRTFVFAATARPREIDLDVLAPRAAMARARAETREGRRPAVLFGAEASGLTNEEVVLADAIVTFPVAPAFPSLNLAQAAALIAYEWGAGEEEFVPERFDREAPAPAAKGETIGLMDHVERELDVAGFFFPPHKADVMKRNMRAVLGRGAWSSQDVQTLRGAVKALTEGPRRQRE